MIHTSTPPPWITHICRSWLAQHWAWHPHTEIDEICIATHGCLGIWKRFLLNVYVSLRWACVAIAVRDMLTCLLCLLKKIHHHLIYCHVAIAVREMLTLACHVILLYRILYHIVYCHVAIVAREMLTCLSCYSAVQGSQPHYTNMPCQCGYHDGMSPRGSMVFPEGGARGKTILPRGNISSGYPHWHGIFDLVYRTNPFWWNINKNNVYNVKVIDDCMVIHTFPARRH